MAYTPKGKGASVVEDVVDEINESGIFPDDHEFLSRIAFVESKYGEAPGTYRSGYHGGIWQVDELGYKETVTQKGLKKYRDKIKAKFGIDWADTEWEDLEKPLYSGLAARLFLARLSAPIPTNLASQAQYWKTHYNTAAGKGTVKKFISDVKQAMGEHDEDSHSGNEENSPDEDDEDPQSGDEENSPGEDEEEPQSGGGENSPGEDEEEPQSGDEENSLGEDEEDPQSGGEETSPGEDEEEPQSGVEENSPGEDEEDPQSGDDEDD